jgi:branched-chain amino acid transport system substrate-binding protein
MKRRSVVLGGAVAVLGGGLRAAWAKDVVGASNGVKFGMSASLTGAQSTYGKDVRDGILAAFGAAAKSTPDRSARFELVVLDDGGDREKCKANVKTLIDSGVSALLGLTSGAAAEACLPLIEEAQIVLLGTASGNMGIRDPKLKMPYHVRAGYDSEYKQMVRYVKDFGMQRVGYVHLKDTSAANQAAMTAALEAVGVKLTISVPLDRNAKSHDASADALLAAKLDCVLFTTNAAPIEGIVARMSAAKYPGTYFSSSFAGQSLINAMGEKGISIIMSQVVPRPNATAATVVKRYREDLAALGGGSKLGYTSLEGYITGRVAIEAAKATLKGGEMSRVRLASALADLNLDLGGYRVRFDGGSKQGSNFVDVVAVDRRGRIIG